MKSSCLYYFLPLLHKPSFFSDFTTFSLLTHMSCHSLLIFLCYFPPFLYFLWSVGSEGGGGNRLTSSQSAESSSGMWSCREMVRRRNIWGDGSGIRQDLVSVFFGVLLNLDSDFSHAGTSSFLMMSVCLSVCLPPHSQQ